MSTAKKKLNIGINIPSNYIEFDKRSGRIILHLFKYSYVFATSIVDNLEFNMDEEKIGNSWLSCFKDDHLHIRTNIKNINNIDEITKLGKFSNIKEIEEYYNDFKRKNFEKNKIDYSKIKDETYQILGWSTKDDEYFPFIHIDKSRKNVHIGCQVIKIEILKSGLTKVMTVVKTIQTKLYDDNDKIIVYSPFGDDYYGFSITKNKTNVDIKFCEYREDDINFDQEMITDCIKLLDGKLKTSKYFNRLISGQLYKDDIDDIKFIYVNYCANKDEDDLIKICIGEYDDCEEQEHATTSFGILTPIIPKEKEYKNVR